VFWIVPAAFWKAGVPPARAACTDALRASRGRMKAERATPGRVVFVGAGPGQADLITLRGAQRLGEAEVVLFDSLADPALRELAPNARWIDVGKRGFSGVPHAPRGGGKENTGQDTINALLVKHAQSGARVVRLKGGDPMIFGRAAEEIEMCRTAGIPVEVVPGITAALGAAAELQIPLTDRRTARRLQFITGHTQAGGPPDGNWGSVADPWTTTVFYMGAGTFAQMLPGLLEAGLVPGTLNAQELDPACGPQIRIRNESAEVRFAISNSFGFGGSNCSLLLGLTS
jgi:uroporphyrin-III C-methyltransferase